VTRRTWSPRGVTPVIRHHFNWKRCSMAAALGYHASDAERGPRLCFHVQQDSYNTQTLIGVLEQLAGFYAGQRVVLLWDGLGAGQGDDAAALVLADAPGHARAGQVGQPIEPVGVEAVQPLVHRLGVAAEPFGQLSDAGAVPAAGEDAGTLDPTGGRVPGSGEPAEGALLGLVGGCSGM
jgi:hypothetical protein